jgi:hypothetical protein
VTLSVFLKLQASLQVTVSLTTRDRERTIASRMFADVMSSRYRICSDANEKLLRNDWSYVSSGRNLPDPASCHMTLNFSRSSGNAAL